MYKNKGYNTAGDQLQVTVWSMFKVNKKCEWQRSQNNVIYFDDG